MHGSFSPRGSTCSIRAVITDKLKPFGTTVFSEMTRLAVEHDAINLSQGFPDFDGPQALLDLAVDAIRSGANQYARSMGHPTLVEAVAGHQHLHHGLEYDPMTEVSVFSGATEGIAASLLGLLNPGDRVALLEPFYDSYPACVALAGAEADFVTLRFPDFAIDLERLEEIFRAGTKLLLLNTPHNPTGRVFSAEEMTAVARLCCEHDVLVVADEVYEHLWYDGHRHVPIASLPGMRERTLTLSSAGKTFSVTGWKIGWATGPADMVAAAQSAHQFLTFATSTPFQVAIGTWISQSSKVDFDVFRDEYDARRRYLVDVLRDVGFDVAVPEGTYFVLADFTALHEGDDLAFVRDLVSGCGVAAIPPSFFYRAAPEEGRRLVRFAFCKRMETLERAAERLQGLRR